MSAARTQDVIDIDKLAFDGPAGPVFWLGPTAITRAALTVVHGPSGSGRSSVLLALTGRLRGVTGRARFGRLDLITDAKLVRRQTAVARIADLVDLESRLSVGESIVERSLTEGVSVAHAEAAVSRVEALADRNLPRAALIETLSRFERSVLTLALGTVRRAELLVIDDVDAGLSPHDQADFAALLAGVAATGPAVVAAALSPDAFPPGTAAVTLTRTTEEK